MPDLYIGRANRQMMRFGLRLKELPGYHTLEIGSGRQELLKDLTTEQIDAVVRHLRIFGAKTPAEINKRVQRFDGILFVTDRPLTENELQYGFSEEQDYIQERAVRENTLSALASDRDPSTRRRRAREVTAELIQDAPNGRPTGKEVKMSVTMDPEAEDTSESVRQVAGLEV